MITNCIKKIKFCWHELFIYVKKYITSNSRRLGMAIDFRIRPPYGSFLTMGGIAGDPVAPKDRTKDDLMIPCRKRIPSLVERSMDLFMQEMDLAGIDIGVLMGRRTNNPLYGNSDDSEIYALCQRYPGRFVGFSGIDPHDKGALDQLNNAADEYGFKGVGLDPGWYAEPIKADDSILMPIYEACAKRGLIASITTSIFLGPDVSWSDPAPIHRVAARFPELKIVVPHAAWPYIPQMLAVALLCPNVYIVPDCYYYVDMPGSEDITKAANGFLKDRLLFASSYPVIGLGEAVERWKTRGLTEEALFNSLHYNAAQLLDI